MAPPLSNILLKRNSKLDMIRSFKDSSYLDDDQKSRSQNWAKQFRPKGPLSYSVESKLKAEELNKLSVLDVWERFTERQQERFSWSSIPSELLFLVLQNLTDWDDITRCSAVCLTWRAAIKIDFQKLKLMSPPFLLLSNYNEHKIPTNTQSCMFFKPQTDKTYEISLPEELKGRRFSGASFGWLLTVGSPTQNMCLWNPFTKSKVELPPPPPQGTQSSCTLNGLKVITSASPQDPNCLVLALECLVGIMYMCRPGDTSSWTKVQEQTPPCCYNYSDYCHGKDTVFYKGNFYYIGDCCTIYRIRFEFDLHHHPPPSTEALPVQKHQFQQYCDMMTNYLLELNGDLLLVSRYVTWGTSTHTFEVYKLDWNMQEWAQVTNIGNHAILLGKHTSKSLVAAGGNYFRANCIYFVDDSGLTQTYSVKPPYDTGVYDMTRRRIEWLHQSSSIWTITSSCPYLLNWIRVTSGI